MGSIGEVWADAGLKIDSASFSNYASMLKQTGSQIDGFSAGTKTAMATSLMMPAAALTSIAAYGAAIGASYETAAIKLETLYGTQQRAREEFQWLSDFAASTPFEFPELLEVDGMLKNAGLSAQEYIKTVGDASSANNKSIQQTTEAIVDAMTGEYERLKEYGITSVDIASTNYQKLGLTVEDVGKRALMAIDKNGQEQIMVVDKNNKQMIASTILAFWNDKYEGAMEKQSQSITGMYSTIKDNIKNGLAELVGFDMSDTMNGMKIETFSLLGALKELAGVAVTVSGAFSNMSEPMQTFVLVASIGGAAALALAGGLIAYSVAVGFATPATKALALSINAAIWPATAVILALALVAAGLVYLDEKTGLVTYSWNLMKDIFTIVANGIMNAAYILWDYLVRAVDGIKKAILDMFPAGFLEGVSNVVNGIITQFSNMGSNIHTQAENVRQDNTNIAASTQNASNLVSGSTGQIQNNYVNTGLAALGMGENTTTGTGQMVNGMNAAGGAAGTMGNQVNAAVPPVNSLTSAMQSSSSMASTFISYLNQVSSSLVSTRENAYSAAKAMQAAGASMEQAQKAYHSYMTSLKAENALGISSGGGNGTGEGNVKIVANPNNYTTNEAKSRAANNVVYNNNKVNTVNNYGTSASTTKTKSAV